jgi:hypothetical protein
LRKVKDVADDIEGSLRLEIEKLTLNLRHYKDKIQSGAIEENEESKAQFQQQHDQVEKLHLELNKLRKENNYIKQHHQKNIDKFKEYQSRIKIDQEQKDGLLQKAMETIQKLKIQKDTFF